MRRFEVWAGAAFGAAFCLLSALVFLETILRKFFSVSLQGIDELGGYVLAVTAALSFSLALCDRAHMRIDIFYRMFPLVVRRLLDGLAMFMTALVAFIVVWMGWITLKESILFKSVSQTPWATPMVIPQSIWLATLLPFLLLSFWGLMRWGYGMVRQDDQILAEFAPKGAQDELTEQVKLLHQREQTRSQAG
jgi:TRAP-type C4-dicarboxylate transport system permease small subunit